MPRRKQHRPKRMKWEDGEHKDDGQDIGQDELSNDNLLDDGDTSSVTETLPGRSTPGSPTPLAADSPVHCRVQDLEEDSLGHMDSSDRCETHVSPTITDSVTENSMCVESGNHLTEEDGPLDFSLKKSSEETLNVATPEENGLSPEHQDSPLDLSIPRRRKDIADYHRQSKLARIDPTLTKPSSPWGYCAPKTLLPLAPGKSSVEVSLWNGKVKSHKSSNSSKHSSMVHQYSLLQNKCTSPTNASREVNVKIGQKAETSDKRQSGRQNPWQTQWISRSGEQTRDVFTCVWCKESFRSLSEMTIHMKQSPRCGMAGMQASVPVSVSSPTSQPPPPSLSTPSKSSSSTSSSSTATSSSNVLMKESMPLPRKLVRGQDVWLGKGAEQTRQILKCMWCGQSFKTLADMTTHMRVTQHYTNIISQEQIISWRSPEDKMTSQSQVNAVLTCKVCDQAFGSLKELSYHMVKNSHYKEHILRSITEGGGRRRQTRERRKKALPVRKLLELERMEIKRNRTHSDNGEVSSKAEVVDGKITCEECAEKVDAKDFVLHIKNCTQNASRSQQLLKNALLSDGNGKSQEPSDISSTSASNVSRYSPEAKDLSHSADHSPSEQPQTKMSDDPSDTTSVLNAIERLIEKSFESKGRRGNSTTGILQRLGIDEEVSPPWHPSSSPGKYGMLKSPGLPPGSPLVDGIADVKLPPFTVGSFNQEDKARPSSCNANERSRMSTPSSVTYTSSPVYSPPTSPVVDQQAAGSTVSSPRPAKSPLLTYSSDSQNYPDMDKVKTEEPEDCMSPRSTDCPEDLSKADNVTERIVSPQEIKVKVEPEYISRSPTPVEKVLTPSPEPETNSKFRKTKREETDEQNSPSPALSSSSGVQNSLDATVDHPLKELQKLLDKTDAHLSRPTLPAAPGSILAFSWACNDATTSDSLMKCAFCETHFISKGAYRHHLSKMHFVKEGSTTDSASSWKATQGSKSSTDGNSSPKDSPNSSSQGETPHSKFLKYTELAKQLSSKYV